MAVEIEKKFLLASDDWRKTAKGTFYRQGYLPAESGCTVRVRTAGATGYLTIKGRSVGAARPEFEYPIPLDDANEMLDTLCKKPLIEKTRYLVNYCGFTWEIDEFEGENKGLLVAEIELQYPEQEFEKPSWIGREVTGESRYFNARLVDTPYSKWDENKG